MVMHSLKKSALALILALLIILPLVLTGCPAPTPGSTNTTTPSSSTASNSTPSGTLNLYGTDPYTLDPATSSEATSGEYIMQIFSGLLTLDANLNPVADIAKSWTISPDGKVYTFTLRQDVKFHDGRPVTAADFKYSWERACNPATASATAGTYLGDIVGAKEMLAGSTTSLSGLKVVNDYTLQVTIDKAKSYFLDKMAFVATFVVDKNNVTSGEWWRKPNGTGPFKLKNWVNDTSLVLERNAAFYGEKAKVNSV
ncbi:MAG: ABC transporter substrate-binding protein, partial [Dehalococcoidales bacterium]|nr:ABC transporter substrate-binding protein [Dehalococcoidales bacterium]